jgi:hypothetical protein
MKESTKIIGAGLLGAAIAGGVALVVKKLNEVDNYDLDFDDDEIDYSDDFVDPEIEDDFSSEDFSEDFPITNESDKYLLDELGLTKAECIRGICELGGAYTPDELEGIENESLVDIYNTLMLDKDLNDEVEKKKASSSVDPFELINRCTREEAINVILKSGCDKTKEELSKLSDGELTQLHADINFKTTSNN